MPESLRHGISSKRNVDRIRLQLQAMIAVPSIDSLYAEHVNPQWVRLLNLLRMNVSYERCSGSELFTADGRRILDFLSGYCVHNVGHNHPAIIAALKEELDREGPAMLQSHVPGLAAELAERLSARAGGRLNRCFSPARAARASRPPSSSRAPPPGAPACCTPRARSTGSPAGRFR